MLGAVLKRLMQERSRNPMAASKALDEAREALGKGLLALALSSVERALRADPRAAKAFQLRASIAEQQRRFHAAESDYRRAVSLSPEAAAVRVDLAAVLHRLGKFDEALVALDDALEVGPPSALMHINRGIMLKELGRFAEAEAALAIACKMSPGNATARCHLAAVVNDQGRRAEAAAMLADLLKDDADDVDAHWILATLELSSGEYSSGWAHYEFRLRRHDAHVRSRDLPWWRPGMSSKDRVLVLAEQGLGDEIMFASCFADLMALSPHCVIECDARLGALFSRSFPSARILMRDTSGGPAPADDGVVAQIAAGSLPRFFRQRSEDFPRRDAFLRASESRVAYWRQTLQALGPGIKIGIAWTGGALKTRRSLRSLALAELSPLLQIPSTQFVSLQYTKCDDEIAALARATGIVVHHWPETLADYDETAALVTALDLVITVTSSIVHLSGALGKLTWVLVPSVPEWRYLNSGHAMPWYSSVRLFRQRELREWAPVIEAIRAALLRLIGERRG